MSAPPRRGSVPDACGPLARAAPCTGPLRPGRRLRLRTGRELDVLNIGAGGVLVETAVRLLPGTWVDVHVITVNGRELVRSRVVRAFVSGVSADRILYRGALAFDRFVELAGPGLSARAATV
jgi:hypothetical protein